MELHSSNRANKLLDYLKAALFMLKIKSLISKKKFQMNLNLFMRRRKFIGKSITNLLTINSHHHSHSNTSRELVLINPQHLHAKRARNKRAYFPCLNASTEERKSEGKETDIQTPLRLEYTSQDLNGITTSGSSPFAVRVSDFSNLQEKEDVVDDNEYTSQELNGITTSGGSPFAVRVCDFSSPQEKEEGGDNGDVDCEAEEFIRRFYEELKEQID